MRSRACIRMELKVEEIRAQSARLREGSQLAIQLCQETLRRLHESDLLMEAAMDTVHDALRRETGKRKE
jgi:hypothetical protein